MAKRFKPSVVTANDLLSGDVVYLDARREWVPSHAKAVIIEDEDEAKAWLAEAEEQFDLVVGPYLAEAEPTPKGAQPVHFREAFRARGPSNYPHGKQAQG